MASWREAFDTYRQPRLLAILFMGFSSGLPLPLTGATLSYWLAQRGVSKTTIGLFALVGSAYAFKFCWSPILDHAPIPVLTGWLGRRRSWALLIQALLAPAILALGFTDPGHDPAATALAAVVVAFLSASQDIVIDAYRIELLRPDEQAAGAAATQWGYRFGLIASGAGALYAVEFGGWQFSYTLMAALVAVGLVTVCLTPEPVRLPLEPSVGRTRVERTLNWLREAVLKPFLDFLRRPYWPVILIFILLYKFGDALAGWMATPLYVALQFTPIEVANISKVFGVIATMVGVAAGSLVVTRIGLYPGLLVCGVLQNVSTLMYAALALSGHDLGMLALSIAAENVTGGMGSAAFVTYLSRLCTVSFTATQYALFSALFALSRIGANSVSGWLVERMDWIPFFAAAAAAGIPALLVLFWLMRQPRLEPSAVEPSVAQP